MMPTPDWAKCHIEVYESPGWLDDCFRSGLWTKFLSAASESFANVGDVSGDFATMSVTEGAMPSGCGWRKDITGLALSTSTYPHIRVRLRGRGTTPQYRIAVEHTDSSENDSGWIDAATSFEAKTIELTTGKSIKYVKLYARCNTASGTAYIDYDYAVILKQWPLIPTELFELDVDLQTTTAVSGFRFKAWRDVLQGVTARRFKFDENVGSWAFDLSKNKGHGAVVNASWDIGGKYSSCLSFLAASNSRVDTAYAPSIPANGAVTIVLWIKANQGATGVVIGSGKGISGSFNRVQLNFSNDKLRIYAKDDALNIAQYTCSTTVADGSWHHIAAVVDPKNDRVQLYVDGSLDGQSTAALGAITLDSFDFTIGCLHNEGGYSEYISGYVDEPAIYERALSEAEIYRIFRQDPMSGICRASTGNLVMIYLAAEPENLVYKLISGRIIDRIAGGEPDQPYIEFVGEDHGEILHERSWTKKYAEEAQISSIAGTMIDDSAPELFREVDATNRSIKNNFGNENVWSLLAKLAETATFSTGEIGANFYVDPGGAVRFKKYGSFSCPLAISDGSNGNAANILDISLKKSIKGNPRLANDVKIVIFEEESQPRDEDSWTESAAGWGSPDPTDANYPQSDTGDKQSGSASVHFNTTNPGTQYRMRLDVSDTDITGFDSIKFYLKYGAGLSVDSFEVRIQKNGWLWTLDYRTKSSITPPGAASWHEMTIDIADMTVTGNPGNIVNNIEIKAVHSSQIGTGGFLIDKLRFIRSEKAGTTSDAGSQASYGKRALMLVDKTITDIGYAGYLADNILGHRKDPSVTVQAKVPGRAQLGYRPPQIATVTSLKDGLNEASFQIQRARHRYETASGYVCELELVAAQNSNGAYEPKIAPTTTGFSSVLADIRRRQYEDQLNVLRTAWE